ncbi:NADH(P)-binding-domain-containing protein [Baffinella frigidus]|nr:NADH(P)-binding-domain-containing protein [Cryptophyta sp. CCMP2293]
MKIPEDLTDAGRRELRDLEGKWKNVCVLGGSKGVGREVVNGLSAMGVNVVALVRSEESKAELEKLPGVKAVLGDAMEASDVIGVLDGCDAAVSTLGGATGEVNIDYKGNMNMIENAGILGVTRVVLVTSVGCGDSKDAIPETVYEALKSALVDKTKAENLLLKYYTNTDYTIIRPGGLVTAPSTGKAILTEDKKAAGKINRADVSALVLSAM